MNAEGFITLDEIRENTEKHREKLAAATTLAQELNSSRGQGDSNFELREDLFSFSRCVLPVLQKAASTLGHTKGNLEKYLALTLPLPSDGSENNPRIRIHSYPNGTVSILKIIDKPRFPGFTDYCVRVSDTLISSSDARWEVYPSARNYALMNQRVGLRVSHAVGEVITGLQNRATLQP